VDIFKSGARCGQGEMRDKALKSLTVCLNDESRAGRGTAVDIG
jgi:hypothetical protein